nr:hypothetical protein [Tanacetum cinerariifolium]
MAGKGCALHHWVHDDLSSISTISIMILIDYEIRDQLNVEAKAVQIILTRIDNDIYSIVDACPNACEMWKEIKRLKQGESINVQDFKTNLFWEFGKFTLHDGESLESYYLRFYKMMNELTRNQCKVTNHQVNVQFLLQLQPEWQRFVTLVKQSQELKNVSYHKLYDILKQHQHEVNEIRAEKIARIVNPLALEIDKLMALISLSFKKIYKPTNNNLCTSSNTSRANQDNSPRIHRNARYKSQRSGNVAEARETVGSSMVQKSGIQCYNCKEFGHVARECQNLKRPKDAASHREKILLCKQEETGIQLNALQADWKDDTDDESEDQELEAHYMYMAKIQEVQNDDHYDVFAIECQHPEQSESIYKTYLIEHDAHNVIIELVDMNFNSEQIDQNDEDVDLAKEHTTSNELDLLFSPMFDELLNGSTKVVSKSSAVSAADAPNQRQQPSAPLNNHTTPVPTCQNPPMTTSVISSENINQAEPHAENDEVADDEFINIFSTTVQDKGEKSSRHVDSSNMHTFYQRVIPTTSVSRPQLKSNPQRDRVLRSNSRGKKLEVEEHHLEVAFRKLTCFICDLKGNDLLTGSRGTNLYSITLQDTNSPNPICLMAKETSSQAWLWNRRLSHLNFDTINLLSKNDIVVGLPKLKFINDHLCSSCELGKAKRKSFHSKLTPSLKRRLHLLHMDLCGPMRIARIQHQKSVARTPEQNSVVERQNRTLVEAARTMLSAAKVPLFFWAESIATACFTQNCSLVIPRHEKTPYHIINERKPSVKFFYIFGSICYIVRDGENLDKMKEKCDECIFVGYSNQSRAYRVFNKRTRVIMESIHVNFDELPQKASDQISFDPAPECQTMALNHESLSPVIQHQEKVIQADRTVKMSNELDLLFSLMFDELLMDLLRLCLKMHADNDQVIDDEFINIFSTPVQDKGEMSSRHVDSSNMHTFYQRYPSEHRWTKDHPLEKVIGNPLQSVRTRRQLESDAEMCKFALTVSRTEPKNIKESMADSAWIESMQEELHQFDRL